MSTVRTRLDRTTRLLAADTRIPFDIYTVLEKTTLFSTYEKTKSGLTTFFRQSLYADNVRAMPDSSDFELYVGAGMWLRYTASDFLMLLLLPLYHCAWTEEMVTIRDHYTTPEALTFVAQLLPNALTLDMVPNDWRDLVETEIVKNKLDLGRFASLVELERYIDNILFSENDTVTTAPEEEVDGEPLAGEGDVPLVDEEREIIAKTLRLDVEEFTTKNEALRLFERRR